MSVSGAALATLLAILFIGPIVWAGIIGIRRLLGIRAGQPSEASGSSDLAGSANAREKLGRSEYIIVLIGYSIGIGNLWRFPYLVGRYGGGAFVFAYLVCLAFWSTAGFWR